MTMLLQEAPPVAVPSLLDLTVETKQVEEEWAVAGVVAAILGIAVGVVFTICSICGARSVFSCVRAVRSWFSHKGC